MRRFIIPGLLLLNAALLAVLLAMWLDPQGQPRNIHWEPPAPVKTNVAELVPALAQQAPKEDATRFMAILDRPLFSPSRRVPPPVVVVPPPPPDPLAGIQIMGLYVGAGGEGGGVIALVEGKVRRLRLKDRIGEWTIQQIVDREVTFTRGDERRTIPLTRRRPSAPAGGVPPFANR